MSKNVLTFFKSQRLLFIIYLFPISLLLWFVANFSVNVPFWDQWELVTFFEKISTGKANFGDFFAQVNEHRIVFPKIIFTALAFISQWDIRYELLFSIFLSIITFCALYKISYNQAENRNNSLAHLANILTCILVFSLVQSDNWLWGIALVWYLTITCLTIAILILTSSNTRSINIKLFLAAIFCFIATFTAAHGLLSWLAVIPSVASIAGNLKQRVRRTLLWILLFTASCAIYLVGYIKPRYHPDTFFFLKHPLLTIEYFFSLLGSPLWSHYGILKITPIIGFIIFSSFLFFVTYFIKDRRSSFRCKAAPWLSLGLFTILFAFMATIGRAGFGVKQAFSSRYTTTSVLLIISLVQIYYLFVYCNRTERSLSRKHVYNLSMQYKFFAGILIWLVLVNSVAPIVKAQQWQLQHQYNKNCLELIHYLVNGSSDNCLQNLYPSPIKVRKKAEILEKLGFRDFPKDIAFITKPVKAYGHLSIRPKTKKALRIKRSGSVRATGWAILPDKLELPKIVLLSYGSNSSFFTSAPVNLPSPDIAKALNSNQFKKVRWTVNFSPKFLPVGETVIRAWVFDPYEKKFVKLVGEPRVMVEEQ